jgi:hypothetical protein
MRLVHHHCSHSHLPFMINKRLHAPIIGAIPQEPQISHRQSVQQYKLDTIAFPAPALVSFPWSYTEVAVQ